MASPKFDARSEKNIATLVPEAQEQARQFLQRVQAAGIAAKIISGTRTFAEQDALFALGRTKPGKIVTNAKGGFSNHNFGIAWDIGVFDGTTFLADSRLYDQAGEIGKSMGLEWGGDFHSIIDKPHFQCRTGKTLAQLRALKQAGKPIPVLPLSLPAEIAVFLNGEQQDIPALFISNHTWIGARAFVDKLGGEIVDAGGSPFAVTVKLDGTERQFEGQIIGEIGFVKFADINGLYNLAFVFASAPRRLDLTR